MDKDLVLESTILRAPVGSTMFGLALDDGSSDLDEMGICVEPMRNLVGFTEFEQYVGTENDLTIYSLRKYLRLALKGNPTILTLLFVNKKHCSVYTAEASELQTSAPMILSKRAGSAFLGYLTAQRMRLLGERGGKDVNRPELVAKYGFDTKYAMHMLRLGYQGIELLETGHMTLPMREPERSFLRDVRVGKYTLQECLTRCGELERELKLLLETSILPKEPDTDFIEDWMLNVYKDAWKIKE